MSLVLVTGATGFIGANVVRALLEKGKRVRVLVRPESNFKNLEDLDVDVAIGDIRNLDSVRSAVRGCSEVYHVAAEYNFWARDPQKMFDANVEGTRHMMLASLSEGVDKVVYTSTVGTIGLAGLPKPCDETTPFAKNQISGNYKASKLEAEKVAMSFVGKGLPLVIVNPSAPIGCYDRKPTPTGQIIVDFMRGRMPAYLDTGLNLIHVKDVAEGHVLAAEKGKIGERYILGNRNMSLYEILSTLSSLLGRPKPRVKIPYGLAWYTAFVSTKLADWVTHSPPAIPLEAVKMAKYHMYFDSSKAVKELGLPQTPIEKALADAVEWFTVNNSFKHQSKGELQWQSQ